MVQVNEIDTTNPEQVQRFLDFPFHLYRDCQQWVPPMDNDARLRMNRQRYPFYRHSDASFFIAVDGGETVGRIAVLEHQRYTRPTNAPPTNIPSAEDKTGTRQRDAFFYLFETIDSREVAEGLFEQAANWARQRGLAFLVGPLGFAAGDSLGLLIEGFEYRPAMGIGYNHSYFQRLVEGWGFDKEFDLVSCHMTSETQFPDKIHELASRVNQRRGFRVVSFHNKRELREIVPKIKQVYNQTLGIAERNSPLTEEEIDAVAQRMISVADPTLIKVVLRDDELIGFLFAFPNLSAAIRRCKGRPWPFGWLWLLLEYRRTRWVDLNGMAIVPQYQGLGANLVLYSEMAKTLQMGRFTDADLVQVRDNNTRMIAELERLGAPVFKRHRVYRRPL
jgi:GNAT superfamily N-acetyltransferase